MKKKIYIHCMALAVIAILETLLLTLGVSYDMLKKQVMEEIRSYAYLISDIAQQEEIPWERFDSSQEEIRVTIVENDGIVIYDNYADASRMENHAQREEIQEALQSGEGESIRNSDTLSQNLFYYAVKNPDGYIIRVSNTLSKLYIGFDTMSKFLFTTFFESSFMSFLICILICFLPYHFLIPDFIKFR